MSHNQHLSPHVQPAPASPAEYGVALPASQVLSQSRSVDLTTKGADSASLTASEAMPDPTKLSFKERWAVNASESQFNALAGAIGGFTSGIVTCPLDVIKTKLQAQGGFARNGSRHPRIYKGLFGTASVIWKEEGIRGLYRGLGPIVMGYLPTWAVWFTVYNKTKRFLGEYHNNSFVVNFWSSIVAGGSSTIVTNPIWVIKTRLMSQSTSHDRTQFSAFPKSSNTPTSRPTLHQPWHYKSTWDAARKMYTTEGILSFYSGLTPALLGLTHVAVQFPAYEFLKVKFTGRGMGAAPTEGEDDKAHWFGILSASIMSKILASSATYPHEVIRTRLQTQRRPIPGHEYMEGLGGVQPGVNGASQQPQPGPKYKGIVSTFRTMLREEGWRAFYAGMGTNMMRAVPAATVTMLTYEYVMRGLNHMRVSGKEKLQLQLGQQTFPGA
ncbi:mitochondrial carrier domain-containing protein [Corynascus novoguineensis]|uniref:Mitochondrial carrier domain-containing protein n=1 Tax=Corynascus novoguineensis TaxID=1126955 RepID=A0AAN7CXH5_9PEZI|nr:mitochondrial carrier domain-containing protein [Corynascus novoguineensis]